MLKSSYQNVVVSVFHTLFALLRYKTHGGFGVDV